MYSPLNVKLEMGETRHIDDISWGFELLLLLFITRKYAFICVKTNSAKIHSLARKSEHLRINQIQ